MHWLRWLISYQHGNGIYLQTINILTTNPGKARSAYSNCIIVMLNTDPNLLNYAKLPHG